jgi:hypothetical protein
LDGVVKVMSIRRKGSEEDRWNWLEFTKLRGTPWGPIPGKGDVEIRTSVRMPVGEHIIVAEPAEHRELEVSRTYICKRDVAKHGMTPGCGRCISPNWGGRPIPCKESSRTRFGDIFKKAGEPRFVRAENRLDEGLGKMLEESVAGKRKRESGGEDKKEEASGSGLGEGDRKRQVMDKREEERRIEGQDHHDMKDGAGQRADGDTHVGVGEDESSDEELLMCINAIIAEEHPERYTWKGWRESGMTGRDGWSRSCLGAGEM